MYAQGNSLWAGTITALLHRMHKIVQSAHEVVMAPYGSFEGQSERTFFQS